MKGKIVSNPVPWIGFMAPCKRDVDDLSEMLANAHTMVKYLMQPMIFTLIETCKKVSVFARKHDITCPTIHMIGKCKVDGWRYYMDDGGVKRELKVWQLIEAQSELIRLQSYLKELSDD